MPTDLLQKCNYLKLWDFGRGHKQFLSSWIKDAQSDLNRLKSTKRALVQFELEFLIDSQHADSRNVVILVKVSK